MAWKNLDKKLAYERHYNREYRRKLREEFFKDKKCDWCKSTELLEFHHIESKDVNYRGMWTLSKIKREEEIAKCIILCRSCHKEQTLEERETHPKHGTMAGYRKGCSCIKCKSANNKYKREQRAKKKGWKI